jgi:hypothetical protein
MPSHVDLLADLETSIVIDIITSEIVISPHTATRNLWMVPDRPLEALHPRISRRPRCESIENIAQKVRNAILNKHETTGAD